ncbi:phage tail protein [Ferruginibacter yonginensis]|uniref:Phage tail protein n=1 Tax=Ferruginibacter yonginensis TaxID=1310416 RepID=A0ABV8QVL6_9BACT
MEGTLAEIRMFAGNFNPRGWLFCNGALLSIAQNTALFSLLGTTYGGNGQVTFAVPDFRGRVAVGAQFSQGPGLPAYQLGEMGGINNITLLSINLPAHNHQVTGNITPRTFADLGNQESPENNFAAGSSTKPYNGTADVNMQPIPVNLPTTIAGSNTPMSIMQPYLGMNYIICAEGIYPSRD